MRFGSLIKLRAEYEERYIILHKHTFSGVLDRIRKSNIRNYSIYLRDGILFSYFEYTGDDYDRDIAEIGRDPVTQDWWKLTDPMQEPLEARRDGEWWAQMDEIYHWEEKRSVSGKARRNAFTTRISGGFENRMIGSLKIAYPILFENPGVPDIQSYLLYHKDGCLYSYVECLGEDQTSDCGRLREALKVENELDWLPMKEVFHTD
jgi:L-rhamnose mutarotase